mgnify:FL=1
MRTLSVHSGAAFEAASPDSSVPLRLKKILALKKRLFVGRRLEGAL